MRSSSSRLVPLPLRLSGNLPAVIIAFYSCSCCLPSPNLVFYVAPDKQGVVLNARN